MAKTREQKKELVAKYKEIIDRSNAILFTEPNKIKVNEINELRKEITDEFGTVWIVKNTLFKLALEEAGQKMPEGNEAGMNMVFFAFSDPTVAAKALKKVASEDKLRIKPSLLEGSEISEAQVKYLADLPPLDDMRAKFVYMLNAPLSGLVRVLSGNTQNLLNVLNAIKTSQV